MNQQEIVKAVLSAGIDPTQVLVCVSDRYKAPECRAYKPLVEKWVSPKKLRAPTATDILTLRNFGVNATSKSYIRATIVGGGAETGFATVFEGWNIWAVWQTIELPFSLMMIGVSRDRQLQIWVEDEVRLNAPGTLVADPIDFKGSQVQILNGPPALKEAQRKEQVPGPGMVLESQDQPPQLRFVRFFNRGAKVAMPWPHDENYLLDRVYQPDPNNEATKGPGPGTIVDRNVLNPGKDVVTTALIVGAIGLLGYAAFTAIRSKASRTVRW